VAFLNKVIAAFAENVAITSITNKKKGGKLL
jgi:hypothetical protein